jgi:Sec-independent protein translocase protein TatA
LLCHSNKTIGIVLIVVALLFRLSDIIIWTRHISDYVWPVLLIIAGAIIVFGTKKK